MLRAPALPRTTVAKAASISAGLLTGDAVHGEARSFGFGFGILHGEAERRALLVPYNRDAGRARRHDPQQLESLGSQLAVDGRHPRDVSARLPEIGNEADRHWIRPGGHHDRDGHGGPLRRKRRDRRCRDDNVHLETHELGSKLRESVVVVLCPARLKGDVLPLHVGELAHPLAERSPQGLAGGIGRAVFRRSITESLRPPAPGPTAGWSGRAPSRS
jgi:hypothetical protein